MSKVNPNEAPKGCRAVGYTEQQEHLCAGDDFKCVFYNGTNCTNPDEKISCLPHTRADGQAVYYVAAEDAETNWDKFEGNDSYDVLSAYDHHKPEYPECENIVDWLRANYKESGYVSPNWVKAGNWIWSDYNQHCCFLQIKAVGKPSLKCVKITFTNGSTGYIGEDDVGRKFHPAIVVPWTPEEAKSYIGEEVKNRRGRTDRITVVSVNGAMERWHVGFAGSNNEGPSLDALAGGFTLKDSGLPCGTLKRLD